PTPPHADGELDLTAQALGITALGGLTFGLIQGGVWGWGSGAVILALLVAAAAGVLFYLGERRAAHPMLPPALFRDPTFSAANAGHDPRRDRSHRQGTRRHRLGGPQCQPAGGRCGGDRSARRPDRRALHGRHAPGHAARGRAVPLRERAEPGIRRTLEAALGARAAGLPKRLRIF